MGFIDMKMNEQALQETRGDISRAIEWLLKPKVPVNSYLCRTLRPSTQCKLCPNQPEVVRDGKKKDKTIGSVKEAANFVGDEEKDQSGGSTRGVQKGRKRKLPEDFQVNTSAQKPASVSVSASIKLVANEETKDILLRLVTWNVAECKVSKTRPKL
eukprot:533155-Amorphochlora_amoeboformis.AAC.1